MIKAIIFDFDGVLMDSKKILHDFIIQYHPELSEKEIEKIFCDNPHKNPIIRNFIKNNLEELDNFFKDKTTKEHFFKGSKELIEKIESKYQLFINTSAPSYNVKSFLSLIGKQNSFKEILGFEIEISKVKKFEMIVNKYNLKKEDYLFITDTLGDLRESEEAEINSIGVTWGVHRRETLEQGTSIAIVDTFEELLSKIQITKNF